MNQQMFMRGAQIFFALLVIVAAAVTAPPAQALGVPAPQGAELTLRRVENLGSYAQPIGPWEEGSMLTRKAEGRIEQTAWRWSDSEADTLALLGPLREDLGSNGWSVLYECDGQSCGGFDFRYSTRVLPEPAMHVDLGDFRYIAARRGRGAATEVLSLLVSRSKGARAGFAQVVYVAPPGSSSAETTPAAVMAPPAAGQTLTSAEGIARALSGGGVVLDGVNFASGSAEVAITDKSLLDQLAGWMKASPTARIAFVGHTDFSGSAEANIQVSQRRAESLRQTFVRDYGINASRIQALGAGFMAPRADNTTEEGRARNRRVEVILTP